MKDYKLESERLYLEEIELKHGEAILKHFTSRVTTYMYPKPNENLEEVHQFIRSMIEAKKSEDIYTYAIFLKSTKEFIGMLGLHRLKEEIPEIGIWTKEEAFGNHYGREAVSILFEIARQKGFKKLLYPVDHRNIASRKIPLYYSGKSNELIQKRSTADNRELEVIDYIIEI